MGEHVIFSLRTRELCRSAGISLSDPGGTVQGVSRWTFREEDHPRVPGGEKGGQFTRKPGGLLKATARMTPRGQMPPDPGTRPIPKGAIRLWHYTPLDNVDSIRATGLGRKYARGDAGNYDLNDPSAGVWASTRRPDDILNDHQSAAAVVEYWAKPDQISGNAESPWMAQLKGGGWDDAQVQEWAKGYHHVIMYGDVPPSQIVDVHEPWHGAGRYMRDDPAGLDSYQWVLDQYQEDPKFNAELEPYVRALHAMGRRAKLAREPRATSTAQTHGITERDWFGEA